MENKYLLHGKLTAKAGQRKELADILTQASQLVSTAKGCTLYAVSHDQEDENAVYVTEIWDSKDDHDHSLKVEGVRELIVHIDRDQKIDGDRDLIKLEDDCEKRELLLFVTKYQEVESYFCQPEHISEIYNLDLKEIKVSYDEFVESLREETKRKLINFVLRERKDLSLNKHGKQDISIIENMVNNWLSNYLNILVPGKELLGKIKNYLQTAHRKNPNEIISISKYLIDPDFQKLLK